MGVISHQSHTMTHCRERGVTHHAYGWGANPWGDWTLEQQRAYYIGYWTAGGMSEEAALQKADKRILERNPRLFLNAGASAQSAPTDVASTC